MLERAKIKDMNIGKAVIEPKKYHWELVDKNDLSRVANRIFRETSLEIYKYNLPDYMGVVPVRTHHGRARAAVSRQVKQILKHMGLNVHSYWRVSRWYPVTAIENCKWEYWMEVKNWDGKGTYVAHMRSISPYASAPDETILAYADNVLVPDTDYYACPIPFD